MAGKSNSLPRKSKVNTKVKLKKETPEQAKKHILRSLAAAKSDLKQYFDDIESIESSLAKSTGSGFQLLSRVCCEKSADTQELTKSIKLTLHRLSSTVKQYSSSAKYIPDPKASPEIVTLLTEDSSEGEEENMDKPSTSKPVSKARKTVKSESRSQSLESKNGSVDKSLPTVKKTRSKVASSGSSWNEMIDEDSDSSLPKSMALSLVRMTSADIHEMGKTLKIQRFEDRQGSEAHIRSPSINGSETNSEAKIGKDKATKKNRASNSDSDLSDLNGLCNNPLANKTKNRISVTNSNKSIDSSPVENGENEKEEDEKMEEEELVEEFELNDTSPKHDFDTDVVCESNPEVSESGDEDATAILPEIEQNEEKNELCNNETKRKTRDERSEARTASKVDKLLGKRNTLAELNSSEDENEDKGNEKKNKAIKKKTKIIDSDYSNSDEANIEEESESENEKGDKINSDPEITQFTDSDSQEKKKKKKRKMKDESTDSSSDLKDDGNETPTKTSKKNKRKRIRLTSSSEGESGKEEEMTPKSQKRRNIKKIMNEEKLSKKTVNAEQEEKERNERLTKRQDLFNAQPGFVEAQDGEIEIVSENRRVILDKMQSGEEIEVDPYLANKLKTHQVEGVRFLYTVTVESADAFKLGKSSPGGILAHCMGLGKTFQVISFLHTIMHCDHLKDKFKHVLILCPANVILTWDAEFTKWLDSSEARRANFVNDINVYKLTSGGSMKHRTDYLTGWRRRGGVFIMGYDMYRILVNYKAKGRKNANFTTKILEALRDPGADMVICDEGHKLKGDKTALTKAVMHIKTKYRVCLTGTPLQNNLMEYYTMINFVKPNLLGNKTEFANRFANPIKNGQHSDSSASDVKVMKRRCHVLYDLLAKRVLRRDYSVLKDYLKPKREFVVFVRPTEEQKILYTYFLEEVVCVKDSDSLGKRQRLLADYHQMMRIWTHPTLLLKHFDVQLAKHEKNRALREEDDFIDDDNDSDSEDEKSLVLSDGDDDETNVGPSGKNGDKAVRTITTRKTKADEDGEIVDPYRGTPPDLKGWWEGCEQKITQADEFDVTLSGKISVTFRIIKECEKIGDKILIFSQSLEVLDLLETYLEKLDECNEWFDKDHPRSQTFQNKETWRWQKGRDFLRIDGSVSSEIRKGFQDRFNRKDNLRARLMLLSTRAASVGTNLIGANRVIIFDACWNPSHDTQSLFRVYRFGQVKPVYIYRLVAQATMEECIYRRQVSKESTSLRVVDEAQVDRHFRGAELEELYRYEPNMTPKTEDEWKKINEEKEYKYKDRMFSELLESEMGKWVADVHEHDSLLKNKADEKLTAQEKREAWAEYERAKKGYFEGTNTLNQGAMIHNQQAALLQQQIYAQEAQTRRAIESITPAMLSELTMEGLQNVDYTQLAMLSDQQIMGLSKEKLTMILLARQRKQNEIMQAASMMQMQPIPRVAQQKQRNKVNFPFKNIKILETPPPEMMNYDAIRQMVMNSFDLWPLGDAEQDSQMNKLVLDSMNNRIMPLLNRLKKDCLSVAKIVLKELYTAVKKSASKEELYNYVQTNIPDCAPEYEQVHGILMNIWNSGRLDPPNDSRIVYDNILREKLRYLYNNGDHSEDIRGILKSALNPTLKNMKEPLLE